MRPRALLFLFTLVVLGACRPEEPAANKVASAMLGEAPAKLLEQEVPKLKPTAARLFADMAPAATPTLRPEVTPLAQTAATGEPEVANYADRTNLTDLRVPNDNLLNVVTLTYAISRDYEPNDLVPLADYFAQDITLGYPTELRRPVVEPLLRMIEAMQAEEMHPQILSGYRSYTAQALAWDKWNTLFPERAHLISAPPGRSEHQLGTVIDFGSPELPGLVGDPEIQFHTYFVKTSEGQWLAEHAHEYGFTLSYTLEAFETTGFYYEPWHYRYVGEAMANLLREEGLTLTEFQLANLPPPCIP
jgi:zinc D-Ala-D-Ala carboxypeptidase